MKRKKQTEKVKITWDRKSTIRLIQTVMLLCIFIFGVYFTPSYFRDRKSNELNGRTIGIVVEIKQKSISTQGFNGQKEIIYAYDLTFVYLVDSKSYTNTNKFPNYGKYLGLINSIRKSNFTQKVEIVFNETNPIESLIIAK